jgi:hypothetical protein
VVLRKHTNGSPDLIRFEDDIVPGNAGVALAWGKDRSQHPHCGGFASSIWSKQSKDFPRANFEVYTIYSDKIVKYLAQIVRFNQSLAPGFGRALPAHVEGVSCLEILIISYTHPALDE